MAAAGHGEPPHLRSASGPPSLGPAPSAAPLRAQVPPASLRGATRRGRRPQSRSRPQGPTLPVLSLEGHSTLPRSVRCPSAPLNNPAGPGGPKNVAAML
ncbi:hypothetical protein NDU88_001275 [Pleurodeles waltl]|uniref:Uncharacterized protein n=1 Tax=Pleurodeles waltl TaxID=8319 RepID=A0AAV7VVY2_PLEWA|nr:hypothetical protein NDU88_001275 [Pleurodeles waltl]